MHTTQKEMFGKNIFKKFLHENLIWKFIFAKKCLDQANQDYSIPKSSRPLFFSKLEESFAIRNQSVILWLLYQKLCSGSKYCRERFSSFKTVILLCLGVILYNFSKIILYNNEVEVEIKVIFKCTVTGSVKRLQLFCSGHFGLFVLQNAFTFIQALYDIDSS